MILLVDGRADRAGDGSGRTIATRFLSDVLAARHPAAAPRAAFIAGRGSSGESL